MHVCLYMYVYVSVSGCIHRRMAEDMDACILHVYVGAFMKICMNVCMCCTCMTGYMYLCIYLCKCVYNDRIFVCMYACMKDRPTYMYIS